MPAVLRLSGSFLSEADSEHLGSGFGRPVLSREASVGGERVALDVSLHPADLERQLISVGYSDQFARVVRYAREDAYDVIQWCGDGEEPAGYPPAIGSDNG